MSGKTEEKPLYLGHRERLRTRFLKDNGSSMPDYEFLELILTFSIPRRDVKDEAKKLIAHFGSLFNVLTAPQFKLSEYGLSQNTIALFKTLVVSAQKLTAQHLKEDNKPVFTHIDYVIDYCKAAILEADVEEFHILLLNKKLQLIEDKLMQRGSIDQVSFYAREVVKYILQSQATSVVLYHNHPSGNCQPSEDDILCTKEIVTALMPMKIKVYDHLIVSKDNYYSFRDHNLIKFM